MERRTRSGPKKPGFAEEFLRAAIEEGSSIQEVLGKILRAYGVAEFAERVKIPSSNLLRAVNPKHNPTVGTLNKILAPFGLRLVVGRVTKKRAA